jgi:deoxyribodipyrimidine photolyase
MTKPILTQSNLIYKIMKLITIALILLSLSMISTRRLDDVAKDAVSRKFRKVGIRNRSLIRSTRRLVSNAAKTNKKGWFQNVLGNIEDVASSVIKKGVKFTKKVAKNIGKAVTKLKENVKNKALQIKNAVVNYLDEDQKEKAVRKNSNAIAQHVANFKNEVESAKKNDNQPEPEAQSEPEAEAQPESDSEPAAAEPEGAEPVAAEPEGAEPESAEPVSSRRKRRAYYRAY